MYKIDTEKKVSIIALVLAGLGIISELLPMMVRSSLPNFAARIVYLVKPLNLQPWNIRSLTYFDNNSLMFLNFPNLVFCVTMLLAALFYVRSGYRETRLLRFSFSVIILSRLLSVFFLLVSTVMYSAESVKMILPVILSYAVCLAMVWLAYRSLFVIGTTKVLDTTLRPRTGHEPETIYEEASKSQRFAHLLFDTLFCFLILSPMILYFDKFWENLYRILKSDRAVLTVSFLIFRCIYYTFFESVLGATPGKFLTETRVIEANSDRRSSFGTIVGRTLARFIPFEPFSFLFGGNWHDAASGTRVVREKRTGVRARRYLWIPLVYIVSILFVVQGKNFYEKYQSYRENKKTFLRNVQTTETELNRWSNDLLIKMSELTYTSNSGDLYLKIESEKDTVVEATLVWVEKYNNYSTYQLEHYYEAEKEWLTRKTFSKKMLQKAVPQEYNAARSKNGIDLFNNGRSFVIDEVDRLYAPNLKDRGTGSLGDRNIFIEIYNSGWPGTITEINNRENDIEWQNELPQYIPSARNSWRDNVALRGIGSVNRPYRCEIVVTDSLDQKHMFLLEGKEFKRTITRTD